MADRKITDLTALTTPASNDVLPIVDVSEAAAADKNKKITVEELLRGAPDGTAAAPGIGFEADPNTGIYRPGADQVAISTNGSQRISIDSNGRLNLAANSQGLRFGTQSNISSAEGAELILNNLGAQPIAFYTNNTERMRLDSSGRLGLGTSSLSYPFHLVGAGSYQARIEPSTATNAASLNLGNASGDFFIGVESSGGSAITGTSTAYARAIWAQGAYPLVFGTNSTRAMTIDSSQRVGIGTSSPSRKLHIQDSGFTASRLESTANYAQFELYGTGGNNYIASNQGLVIQSNSTAAVTIDSSQRVGIGTTSPGALVHLNATNPVLRWSGSTSGNCEIQTDGASLLINADSGNTASSSNIAFRVDNSERARIDSSGRLLVGTSSARANFLNSTFSAQLQVEGTGHDNSSVSIVRNSANSGAPYLNIGKTRGSSLGSNTAVQSDDGLGQISFQGADGSELVEAAAIAAQVDGTPGANDMPGRLVFSTTADGASSPTERMRITNNGTIMIGSTSDNPGGANIVGTTFGSGGSYLSATRDSSFYAIFNRKTNDGDILVFAQDGTTEGSVSVSGTTVSYNGAHLSRWSQLPGGAERTEILRGTVLSNIDEMCAWGEEENEQLNRMKVSDVEGDPNVSGVFQAWDDDDDTYTDDFYCAMTGDFIIRISAGIPVHRGQLLMSAGNGTAKPQDDDIVRSKTVAKVTSTHVTCTYDDGSYCVPCVLMAC